MQHKWTKKQRTERACRISGSDFNRVWYSLPVGIRRTTDGLTLSVLVDAVWKSWVRERALVTHQIMVTSRPVQQVRGVAS